MQISEDILQAIQRYLAGTANEKDKQIVNDWYNSVDDAEVIIPAPIADLREQLRTRMRGRLIEMLEADRITTNESSFEIASPQTRTRWIKRIAVAASILLMAAVGGYFALFRGAKADSESVTVALKDIQAPDKVRATLRLTDGRLVYLDSVSSGTLAEQGQVQVLRNAAGEIIYQGAELTGEPELASKNTLYNPRASQVVQLVLSDGSRVWLNSESSITYPVAFTGSERRVEVTGEAYFEVARDARRKFIVNGNNQGEIEVLGTHFNVNAYPGEGGMKVTLLEGIVSVGNQRTGGVRLKPGQQAIGSADSPFTIQQTPDLEQVMAWKNGLFHFDGTDLQTVLRQIQRWYDVEIVYEEPIRQTFYGNMTRQTEASKVLGMLERTGGVHFEIKGKTVIVKK